MFRLSLGSTLIAAVFFANSAFADHGSLKPKAYDSLGKCVKAALSEKDGKIVKVEFKSEKKVGIYEFDIQTADGKAWDVECNAKTGKVTEIEEEVKADDPRLKRLLK
jgi:uncharacterized membrane protein YkoI